MGEVIEEVEQEKVSCNSWWFFVFYIPFNTIYHKCPKISYPKVVNKMAYANSADKDQTAPLGAVSLIRVYLVFAIPLSILRSNCIKSKI